MQNRILEGFDVAVAIGVRRNVDVDVDTASSSMFCLAVSLTAEQ